MLEKRNLEQEARILSAVAHASAVFVLFGPVVPALIWMVQHKKSNQVAFHSLQAVAYQLTSLWISATVIPLLLIVWLMAILRPLAAEPDPEQVQALVAATMAGMWALILAGFILYVAVALAGSMSCLMGREYYYPWLGRRLAGFLGHQPGVNHELSLERTDAFWAAAGHACAIVSPWGMALPLLLRLTQKGRSAWLDFQALQALVFQGAGALALLAGSAILLISALGMLAIGAVASRAGSPDVAIPALAACALCNLCLVSLFLLISPLYFWFASLACYRILRGRDYRYPLLGGMLARRYAPPESGLPSVR